MIRRALVRRRNNRIVLATRRDFDNLERLLSDSETDQLKERQITWGDTLFFWGEHGRKKEHNKFVHEIKKLNAEKKKAVAEMLDSYLKIQLQDKVNIGLEISLQRDHVELKVSKEKTARWFLSALSLISLAIIAPSMYLVMENRTASPKFEDNLIPLSLTFCTLVFLYLTITRSSYFNGSEYYQLPIDGTANIPMIEELPDDDDSPSPRP